MSFLLALLPAALGGTAAAGATAGTAAAAGAATAAGTAAATTGASSALMNTMLGLSLAGTALSAAGMYSSASEQANAMEMSAKLAEREGELRRASGKEDAYTLSKERRRTIGTQLAELGASGANVGYGSPLEVMANTAAEYERDIQLKGYGADMGVATSGMEADIYRYGAQSRRRAGVIGAGGTLLAGMGQSLLSRYR